MVRGAVLLSLLAAACAAQSAASPADGGVKPAPVVPGAYIVEYEDGQDVADAFKSKIAPHAEVKMDLHFKLFNGASILLHDAKNESETAAKVAALPEVKGIWQSRHYKIPEHTVHWAGNVQSAQEAELVRRQAGVANDTFSPHAMTQVNDLRNKGAIGTGIKVAVIDTGVDYKHPALGGCFGPGCLVAFGTDIVGDAYTGFNTPVPDPDPMDCGGHGTHVSGIIAAQANNPFGIVGAASGVTMGMFRVFGCSGSAQDDVLIKAYNLAYESGADLITASIGGSSGWSEEAWAVAVSRIVDMGVPCLLAAGNDGANGLFYASGAADAKGATAIASFDNAVTPSLLSNATYTTDASTAPLSFGYAAGTPADWANVTLPLWSVNLDTTDPANGCNPLPDNTPDLSNYIVLIRRGTCTFVQKATNAQAKGARYIIFYNNQPAGSPVTDVSTVPGVVGVAGVEASTGASWVAALKAGQKVTVAMTDPNQAPKFLLVQPNTLTGGSLSSYTSWGPTWEADNKPQIAAPGGNILSTYPRAKGSYAVLSGTSMATPLSAAVYALIMGIRGTKDPKTIENLLSSTAKPALFNAGGGPSDFLAPVSQQGAGLIQASDAAYATTLLSVSSISFNDTDHFQPVQNFSISNTGPTPVTYTLSNRGAGTGYTFGNDSAILPDAFPNEMVTSYASIAFSEASFVIPAGGRKLVGVTVTPPTGLDAKRLAVYSGYVAINGSDGSALSLPYMGVYGSLHSHATLNSATTFMASNRSTGDTPPPSPANKTFILPPRGQSNNTAYANRTELLRLSIGMVFGSPLVLADVVPINICGPANETVNLGVKTLGQMAGYPAPYQPRDRGFTTWDGLLANGQFAPPGLYKVVVRALRVFGDSTNPEEYDKVETLPFRIRYLKS